MKKNIVYSMLAASILSCSTKNTNYLNRKYHSFTGYYNALFNGEEAMGTELENREKSHKENYYKDYISIMGFEALETKTDAEKPAPAPANENISPDGEMGSTSTGKSLGPLDISIMKAQKVISKKSIVKDGVERNSTVFDAYVLLIRAYLYQNKHMEALETSDKALLVYKKTDHEHLFKIYKAHAFTQLNNEYQAQELYVELLKLKNLPKAQQQLMSIHYAEFLLKNKKEEQAVHALDTAFALNKNKKIKSRIAYLKGQVLSHLGHLADAKQSFKQAFDLADDFEFETKSQLQMAYNFNPKEDQYEPAIAHFDELSKIGTYGSKRNEFLYAQGIIARKANKQPEATAFFKQSIKEKISDPQIRGLAYAEMATFAYHDEDYPKANKLYDSAVAKLTYEPSKLKFQVMAKQTKDVATNLSVMTKNDSVMSLYAMPKAEREVFIKKFITELKTKEEKIAAEKERSQLDKAFTNSNVGSNNQNSLFKNQTGSGLSSLSTGSGFYFANKTVVTQGMQEFKQLWGERSSEGYWRGSKSVFSTPGSGEMQRSTPSNTRRYDVNYYLEQLPKDSASIAKLKYARDTAQLGLGNMYHKYFDRKDKATNNWYKLVDLKPEEKIKQQALLLIFKMHYETNPALCEKAKQMIIDTWPNSELAAYVKNPTNGSFSKASPEAMQQFEAAYALYTEEKFDEAKLLLPPIVQQYPKDRIVPKVQLLDAFISAKKQDMPAYSKGLGQMVLAYPETAEGKLAKQLLEELNAKKTDKPKPTELPKSNEKPTLPNHLTPQAELDDNMPSTEQKPKQDNKPPVALPPPPPVPEAAKQNTPKGSSTVPNLSTMPKVP
jgi:tetratricopeptide (TPR) repeat protein